MMRRVLVPVLLLAVLPACAARAPQPPPTWPLTVIVLDPDPVVGAVVDIEGGLYDGRQVMTNSAGVAEFGLLRQGGQTVCAESAQHHRTCGPASLTQPLTLTLTLERLPPPPPPIRPLVVDGDQVRTVDDGARWNWYGVTSFRLLEQLARGQTSVAVAALDQVATLGFNTVRVLTVAINLFDLAPEDGRAALPALLELAAARGLYVNVVAVADSGDRDDPPYDWVAHARQVAVICAAHANCLYEFANEPANPSQDDALGDLAHVQALAEAAVAGLNLPVWLAGPADDDEALVPTGSVVSRHLNRGRDMLNQARHLKDVLELRHALDRYIVNNEPTGVRQRHPDADPTDPEDCDFTDGGGQRFWCPAFFAALGFMEAGWGGGGTFHTQSGLQSAPFTPDELTAAAAYLEARALIPDQEHGAWQFFNSGHAGGPVLNAGGSEAFEDRGDCEGCPSGPIIRAFAFVAGGAGVLGVLHRPVAYPEGVLEIGNGWRRDGVVLSHPQFTVFRVVR